MLLVNGLSFSKEDVNRMVQSDVKDLFFDADSRTLTIHQRSLCCTDMHGAIKLARKIDHSVKRINTFSGSQRDIDYILNEQTGVWSYIDQRWSKIKEITREHRTRIKEFHNAVKADLLKKITHELRVANNSGCVTTLSFLDYDKVTKDYLKMSRKMANNELNRLADELTQEDPSVSLTNDMYDELKEIIKEHSMELMADILHLVDTYTVFSIPDQAKRASFNQTIRSNLTGIMSTRLLETYASMDEVVENHNDTFQIDELMAENAKLKKEIAILKKQLT